MVLPAFGIISEVIPVFARKPIFGYAFVAASTCGDRLPQSGGVGPPYVRLRHGPAGRRWPSPSPAWLIAVPTGIKIFNWLATIWGGASASPPRCSSPLGFLVMFTIGGLTGVSFAVVPVDWQMEDSYYVVAHMHYVLFGGTLFAMFAGIYYWFPKFSGRMLSEAWGKCALLADVRRLQPHLLPHAHPGYPGHAAAYLHLPRSALAGAAAEPDLHRSARYLWRSRCWSSSSTWCSAACARAGRRATTPGTPGPWSGPPPRRRRCTTSSRCRRCAAAARSGIWRTPRTPDWTAAPEARERDWLRHDDRQAEARHAAVPELRSGLLRVLILAFVFYRRSPANRTAPRPAQPGPAAHRHLHRLPARQQPDHLAGRPQPQARQAAAPLRLWLAGHASCSARCSSSAQGTEYLRLIDKHVTIDRDVFGTAFFTLTGFHGFHVFVGLVALLIAAGAGPGRRLQGRRARGRPSDAVSLYWHFVDGVWVVIFSIVYLWTLCSMSTWHAAHRDLGSAPDRAGRLRGAARSPTCRRRCRTRPGRASWQLPARRLASWCWLLVSPLDTLGDRYLFSAHMLQHLLLILVVPPLLLLGLPPACVERGAALRRRAPRPSACWASPLLAWPLGIGTLWIWHLPVALRRRRWPTRACISCSTCAS